VTRILNPDFQHELSSPMTLIITVLAQCQFCSKINEDIRDLRSTSHVSGTVGKQKKYLNRRAFHILLRHYCVPVNTYIELFLF
jgi:hypothetical protein